MSNIRTNTGVWITYADAVDRMAKAIRQYEFPKTKYIPGWADLQKDIQEDYLAFAKAALDELINQK